MPIGKTRPAGTMPEKPISCEPLVEILKRKLKGEKGIARQWLRCKIKELTGGVKARRQASPTGSGQRQKKSSGNTRDET